MSIRIFYSAKYYCTDRGIFKPYAHIFHVQKYSIYSLTNINAICNLEEFYVAVKKLIKISLIYNLIPNREPETSIIFECKRSTKSLIKFVFRLAAMLFFCRHTKNNPTHLWPSFTRHEMTKKKESRSNAFAICNAADGIISSRQDAHR
ncbi:hypothetical protein PUN28_001618 [Cardiocondyla obscurior]|uniref:Uncharacterized protein n=1 Tax=Cardiocondyla obscurior TaxID=286306 RepID=A0AAW2GQC1_9HYME